MTGSNQQLIYIMCTKEIETSFFRTIQISAYLLFIAFLPCSLVVKMLTRRRLEKNSASHRRHVMTTVDKGRYKRNNTRDNWEEKKETG